MVLSNVTKKLSMRLPTNKWNYISETEILVVHAKIIDAFGGSHGIRDIQLIKGAVDRPKAAAFGRELFIGIFEKSASYFDSISRNHPFVDGNKRTSFAIAVFFLEKNGFLFEASNPEVEKYVVQAVVLHQEIKQIASWLKRHSKELT